MSTEFTIREGHDIRELSGSGRGTWAGSGAADLGLTGDVDPADFEALSDLVADDEDQADEPEPMPWELHEYAADGLAAAERLRPRRTQVAFSQKPRSAASGSSMSASGVASGSGSGSGISGSDGLIASGS